MSYTFHLPKLELRSKTTNGKPEYIIKGYATTPNNPYTYKTVDDDRSFKEYFTAKALENIKRKMKNEKIFVDAEHIIATNQSSQTILDDIQKKTGVDVSEQIDYIKQRFKHSEIPMFKIHDIEIDDNGLFLEIHGNPFYRDGNEEQQKYFDSVWGSLETGFINGMSFNFKPTETVQINDGLTQINDIDIYGISLTGGAANDFASITEVAMRSIEHTRGGQKCQKTRKITTMLL